jgi:hypothetical protein
MAENDKAGPASAQILDFTNVKDRGSYNPKHKPAGDYKARVIKVEQTNSQSSGNPMWVFAIQLDDDASAVYPLRCVLNESNIWKVRNLLVAAGMTVPKKRVKVDPNKVIGKTIGVTLEDDEYEGRLKSVVQATFPASDLAPAPNKVAGTHAGEADVETPDLTEDTGDDGEVADEELEALDVEEL